MRSLSCLAVVVAALASFACGSAPESAEASTHEFAIEGINGLTRVTVDTEAGSCTVDNVRFGRCTLTRTSSVDIISGQALELCDLETDNGSMHSFECDDAASEAAAAVDRYRERVAHCPEGG
jgi:hypothetical protein